MKLLRNVFVHVSSNWQKYILLSTAILIFLIPNLFWGGLYIVGGDDGRFYYIFPLEYLKNFSFNIISNNTLGGNMGYLPVSYSAPTVFVLLLLKTVFPFWNTQLLAYGFILSFGFMFFYLFLQEIISERSLYLFWCRIFASLFYIFSLYMTKTFFQHQLISMYSIMVLPVCLYLFIVGIKKRNLRYIVASSLFYSIFSSTLYGLPWLLPAVLMMAPFLFYFQRNAVSFSLKAVGIFIGFTLLCNTYWIIHYIIPVITHSGGDVFVNHLLSDNYRQQNDAAIAAITNLNSPVNQLVSYLRTSWSDREGISLFEAIGAVYLLVILYAGSILNTIKKSGRELYIVVTTGFCITLFFVTPNFGELNLKIFQFLNNTVPLFVMFRNMYDKFALAMAFQYALAVYIALYIFNESRMQNIYKYFVLFVLLVVTVIKAYPYVFIKYNDDEFSTRITGAFNREFIDLMGYIKKTPTTSRFLWYPMTYPGYIVIGDSAGSNHFYSGLSLMQVLSQKSDIAGYYGIQTPSDTQINSKIYSLLKEKNFDEVGKRLQQQNIGYVIENKEYPPDISLKFLNENGFMSSQSAEYLAAITGEKIKEFGSRYTLYSINKKYQAPTVYVTSSLENDASEKIPVKYNKNPDGSYEITVDHLDSTKYLVFSEPYNSLWEINILRNGHTQLVNEKHALVNDFGNSWKLDPQELFTDYPQSVIKNDDGTYTMNLRISFKPMMYTRPAILFSVLVCLLGLIFILR